MFSTVHYLLQEAQYRTAKQLSVESRSMSTVQFYSNEQILFQNAHISYNGVFLVDCAVTVFLCTVTVWGPINVYTVTKRTATVLLSRAGGMKYTVMFKPRKLEGTAAGAPKCTANVQCSAFRGVYSNCSISL